MQELISRQLVRYLERRGVEHIFGLCGHTNIAVLTELTNSPIKFINTRHEQVAAHMADGYAQGRDAELTVHVKHSLARHRGLTQRAADRMRLWVRRHPG